MTEDLKTVYLIHGEDEHGITQQVASLQAGLGDPALASLNITRLDGQNTSFDQLVNATSAVPFLLSRRLVILSNPLVKLATKDNKEKFLAFLDKVPGTTTLVIVQMGNLGSGTSKRYQEHYLEKWANSHTEKAKIKWHKNTPEEMVTKIYAMAKHTGAEINGPAAQELARLVGQDTMLAAQEVGKLGAYVNYQRPITIDDVKLLVEDTAPASIFAMVDDMSTGKQKNASALLQKLLEESEPIEIMSMVVRQFRMLLLAREVVDARGSQHDCVKASNL